ncbi:MAG: hypothetical protein P8171_08190 [Candidatus Thiodiazotropha sp.]
MKHRGDPFFDRASNQGQNDFQTTLRNAFDVDISKQFNFPCHYTDSPFGCYMNVLFGNDLGNLKLGKLENLRVDLRAILSSYGALTEALDEQITQFPIVNPSDHLPYRSYYDATLRELIEKKDLEVLRDFDYCF